MDLTEFIKYCESLEGACECFPFDKTTLVYKVKNKMFGFCDIVNFESITLKCDPEKAIELRERYPEITPGFHMNKKYWNTVSTKGELSDKMMCAMIKESYMLVKA